MAILHALHTGLTPPPRFTYPFAYEPHPLCLLAAAEVQRYLATKSEWKEELEKGKMFGVLVVESDDGRLAFLAAYSGQLGGRNDWEWFVPPVYDLLQPGGHFKREEARISDIGVEIAAINNDERYRQLLQHRQQEAAQAAGRLEAARERMAKAKSTRDEKRRQGLTPEEEEALIRESQFMKAELRRLKQALSAEANSLQALLMPYEERIAQLKAERKRRSEVLQQWLFEAFRVVNARGEARPLSSIFAATPGGVPPSGAGECCAPKLLQYAYLHHLRPRCMAEFWWGASPMAEVRHHLHYYPACRGKCLPILTHMLQGLDVDPNPLAHDRRLQLDYLYDDEALVVIVKPSGLQSVPGRTAAPSVLSMLQARYPEAEALMPVHRLDMDTSGVMVVAKTREVYTALQRQFASRSVTKRYVAIVSPIPTLPPEGTISLPLRPDPMDRPRQVVDHEHGKSAVTHYRIIERDEEANCTRLQLHPLTGRTHQLRVHCAHPLGMNAPIVGDPLYGQPANRLLLHAESLTFTHPLTHKTMTFESRAEF